MDELRNCSTKILWERLLHCDELETFKKTFRAALQSESTAWQEKIQEVIARNGYTRTELAALCGVSRTAVTKWCNGSLPSSRDDFIRVGFAARYDLTEMNFFLQRYGKYPALYARSLEDSVCIFVLNSKTLPRTYEVCYEIITRVKERMRSAEKRRPAEFTTVTLNGQLMQLESMEQLESFVAENALAFQAPYAKLYAYIKAFIIANNTDYATNSVLSVDSLAKAQNWSSSLRQCVSAVRQKSGFPCGGRLLRWVCT